MYVTLKGHPEYPIAYEGKLEKEVDDYHLLLGLGANAIKRCASSKNC